MHPAMAFGVQGLDVDEQALLKYPPAKDPSSGIWSSIKDETAGQGIQESLPRL